MTSIVTIICESIENCPGESGAVVGGGKEAAIGHYNEDN